MVEPERQINRHRCVTQQKEASGKPTLRSKTHFYKIKYDCLFVGVLRFIDKVILSPVRKIKLMKKPKRRGDQRKGNVIDERCELNTIKGFNTNGGSRGSMKRQMKQRHLNKTLNRCETG